METRERVSFRKLVCPECSTKGSIQRILLGMPESEFDYTHFQSGGCVIQGGGLDPDVGCARCGWSGFRNDLDDLVEWRLDDMKQQELLGEDYGVLYYWDVVEKGVHFEFESYAGDDGGMDVETQFIMPTSEFHKVYELFDIDTSLDIAEAIQLISDSQRGEELYDALGTEIGLVDKFVFMN
jgi:hypothetical protein